MGTKATTVSLNPSIVHALIATYGEGYLVADLINAIRAAEGRAQLDDTTSKRGRTVYKPAKKDENGEGWVTLGESESRTYVASADETALVFLAWHDDTGKMLKKYRTLDGTIVFPKMFGAFLIKFVPKKETAPVS